MADHACTVSPIIVIGEGTKYRAKCGSCLYLTEPQATWDEAVRYGDSHTEQATRNAAPAAPAVDRGAARERRERRDRTVELWRSGAATAEQVASDLNNQLSASLAALDRLTAERDALQRALDKGNYSRRIDARAAVTEKGES